MTAPTKDGAEILTREEYERELELFRETSMRDVASIRHKTLLAHDSALRSALDTARAALRAREWVTTEGDMEESRIGERLMERLDAFLAAKDEEKGEGGDRTCQTQSRNESLSWKLRSQ